MFALSNSHDFSYLKEHLEREKITYQSNLVIDVT